MIYTDDNTWSDRLVTAVVLSALFDPEMEGDWNPQFHNAVSIYQAERFDGSWRTNRLFSEPSCFQVSRWANINMKESQKHNVPRRASELQIMNPRRPVGHVLHRPSQASAFICSLFLVSLQAEKTQWHLLVHPLSVKTPFTVCFLNISPTRTYAK